MRRQNWYLVALALFAIATIVGVIGLAAGQGHWTQIAIPAGLLVMIGSVWWQSRAK